MMLARSLVVVTFALAACGSSNSPSGPVGGGAAADMAMAPSTHDLSMPATATSTVKIAVPSTLMGTPRQLVIAAFDSYPVQGPPAGILYQGSPSLPPGQTVSLSVDASGLTGTKSVLAVLYMNGGGQLQPMPGVDYDSAPESITFTGQPLDLGTLTLMLIPAGDGGI